MNLPYEVFGELVLLTKTEVALILIGCGVALITLAFLIDWVTSRPTDEAPSDSTEDQEK
jgi:hypothetical protein